MSQHYEVTLTERCGRKYSRAFRASDPRSALIAALGSKDSKAHSYEEQIVAAGTGTLVLYAGEV